MKTIFLGILLVTLIGCSKKSSVVPTDPIVEQPKIYTITFVIKGVGEEKTQTSTAKAGETVSFKAVNYQGYTRTTVVINNITKPLPFLKHMT